MAKIVQADGSIIDGNDLRYSGPTEYINYLLIALNHNGWTASAVDSGTGGYNRIRLTHPNEPNREIHVYLKPVVWRSRDPEEKAAQMSANLDMRGFDAITNGDPETTYALGIYRDPTVSNDPANQSDPYVICGWVPTEWGQNHGAKSFNYFIRTNVISDAFKYGFASQESDGRVAFAFKPEFIHYYLFNRDSLHSTGKGQNISASTSASTDLSEVPLNQILYGPPGTGKTYATVTKAVEIITGEDTSSMSWSDKKRLYDEFVDRGNIRFVTFHQSYSYEEFIEGIKPVVDSDGNVKYEISDGVFKQLCLDAQAWKIRVGDVFQNGNGDDLKIIRSNESITNIQKEVGAIISLPTDLIFDLVKLVQQEELSLQNITDRERDGIHIGDLMDVPYDKYIFGYNSILRPLVEHIITKEDSLKNENYVIIIDEINRGNISRIFGELITLIEDSKRLGMSESLTARLTYSGQKRGSDPFGVPPNVFILGTMNSADRSIALIDTALRRRFTFYNYSANSDLISTNIDGVNVQLLFESMNNRIEFLLDKDHLLGHGYFMKINSASDLGKTFRNKIIPLLEEYFYGDHEKIQYVLGDNPEYGKAISLRIIDGSPSSAQRDLFGTDIDGFEDKSLYSLRSDLLSENYADVPIEVYKAIYGEFPSTSNAGNQSDGVAN